MSYQNHAWRHRPKSQGGTDPLEIASGLPVAFGSRGQASKTVGPGATPLEFTFVSWNDPLFGYAVTVGTAPKRARYITLAEEGTYMAHFLATWNSAFTVGDFPFIQPSIYLPSGPTEDVLSNVIDVRSMDDAVGLIYGQQNTAAESAFLGLAATVIFSWDQASVGETSIGLGVNLSSGNGRTKNFGAKISVVRLGDAAVEETIV